MNALIHSIQHIALYLKHTNHVSSKQMPSRSTLFSLHVDHLGLDPIQDMHVASRQITEPYPALALPSFYCDVCYK